MNDGTKAAFIQSPFKINDEKERENEVWKNFGSSNGLTVAMACGTAMAIPSEQIAIPSTDAKGFKEVTLNVISTQRFSSKADAGASSYDAGVLVGVLPFESLKLEVGFDYLTTNLQNDNSGG